MSDTMRVVISPLIVMQSQKEYELLLTSAHDSEHNDMKTGAFTVSISLVLVLIPVIATTNHRSKRGNSENFGVLLNIYKMNPLKHSNVFKTFSNRVLLPGPDDRRTALNFNVNESREKENNTNTKLENVQVINYTTHKTVDRPLYIEETPENFESGQFLSKLVSMNLIDFNSNENDDTNIFNDDLVETSTVPSKPLQNYVNRLKNYVTRIAIKETGKLEGSLKVVGNVNNNVSYDVAETIVLK